MNSEAQLAPFVHELATRGNPRFSCVTELEDRCGTDLQHCVTAKFRGGQECDKTLQIKLHQLRVYPFLSVCVLGLSPELGKLMM